MAGLLIQSHLSCMLVCCVISVQRACLEITFRWTRRFESVLYRQQRWRHSRMV